MIGQLCLPFNYLLSVVSHTKLLPIPSTSKQVTEGTRAKVAGQGMVVGTWKIHVGGWSQYDRKVQHFESQRLCDEDDLHHHVNAGLQNDSPSVHRCALGHYRQQGD